MNAQTNGKDMTLWSFTDMIENQLIIKNFLEIRDIKPRKPADR